MGLTIVRIPSTARRSAPWWRVLRYGPSPCPVARTASRAPRSWWAIRSSRPARLPSRDRPSTAPTRWRGLRRCRRWVRRRAARSRRPIPPLPQQSGGELGTRSTRCGQVGLVRANGLSRVQHHEGEEVGAAAGHDGARPLPLHRSRQRRRNDGVGREVELDGVAGKGSAEWAARVWKVNAPVPSTMPVSRSTCAEANVA